MLLRGCTRDYPYKDLVDDARGLLMREWEVRVRHISRDANVRADHLAKLGHTIVENFLFFEEPPDVLRRT